MKLDEFIEFLQVCGIFIVINLHWIVGIIIVLTIIYKIWQ